MNRKTAAKVLNPILARTIIHPRMVGKDILVEPFFKNLLWAHYHRQIILLKTKSRLYVEKGRLMVCKYIILLLFSFLMYC